MPRMKIVSHRYGKRRIRVLKVTREGRRHEVKELDVACFLEGDFAAALSAADNSKVVPTDTIRNTVTVLAHRLLGRETERFGLEVGRHFLARYPQVNRVEVELSERRWDRRTVGGRPHGHAFLAGAGSPFARVVCVRGRPAQIESGIDGLLIMKCTGSGFAGYPKCEFTTLQETADRILATNVRATWRFKGTPADFNAANRSILDAMLEVFAVNYSPSVQATIHEMAEAALAACPQITRVELALPNKHYLPANLKPFGLENPNVTFVPTDEPHGQIEAVIERK